MTILGKTRGVQTEARLSLLSSVPLRHRSASAHGTGAIREVNTEVATFHPRGTKQGQHGSKWGSPWTERNAEIKDTKWRNSTKDNSF